MVLSRLALAKTVVHLAALTPMAILAWQVVDVARTGSNALGADPVAEIEHRLGLWALRLLMVALAVTPLRQLTGQPVLVRFRRMLGLYAFAYATLHFGAYLVLDLRGYWEIILEDIARRPYITVGFTAWLLLAAVPAPSPSTRPPRAAPGRPASHRGAARDPAPPPRSGGAHRTRPGRRARASRRARPRH